MAEQVQVGDQQTPPAPQTPEQGAAQQQQQADTLYAGKYKTVDELVKGYKELESKLGQPKPTPEQTQTTPNPQPQPEPQPAKPEGGLKIEQPSAVDQNGQLDFSKYEQEFAKSGTLSDASYKELNDNFKLPRAMVDAYIAGQQAQAQAAEQQVFNRVGGQENYTKMADWARTNLSEAELRVYNEAIASNDMARIQFAVDGLRQRYTQGSSNPPSNLVSGETSTQAGGPGFQSWAEVTAAMGDPRYQNDPAYRQSVEAKIARSKL